MSQVNCNDNNIAILVANNIYDDKGAISELVANYYDNDATQVDIELEYVNDMGKDYIIRIIIRGNGSGIPHQKMMNLLSIGDSDKKIGVSKIYKRKFLGSYGVAFVSFQRLGKRMQIYSKTNDDEELYMEINVDERNIVTSSEIFKSPISMVNYDSGVTLIITECKIRKDIFDDLSLKLSLLPLSDLFQVFLNNNEVTTFNSGELVNNPNGDFIFYKGFKFFVKAFFQRNINEYIPEFYRGIHFVINGRIIEYDLYNHVKNKIGKSPGKIQASLLVYIYADELSNELNVSRNRLNDETIVRDISIPLGKYLSDIRPLMVKDKDVKTKQESIIQNSNQKEKCNLIVSDNQEKNELFKKDIDYQIIKKQRIKNIMLMQMRRIDLLSSLNLSFCFEPKHESELIVLTIDMCLNNLLPFQILDFDSRAHIDSVVIDRHNEYKCMEFEFELCNFFEHQHSYIYADIICCWKFDITKFDSAISRYMEYYSDVNSIEFVEMESQEEFYQYKLVFEYGDQIKVIEVFEISDMISKNMFSNN